MRRTLNEPRRLVSLPSIVFALSFVLLGWIASHSIAYALIGLVQHGHHEHHHAEEHIHGYMSVLKLMGGIGLVLAFTFALRAFFRHGTFGEWLRDGSLSGISKQVALATVLPAVVFVFVEHLERLLAGTGTYPSVLLLAVGVLAQLVVGLVCLALVRVTLRIAERVIHSITRRRLVPVVRGATSPVVESVLFVRSRCPMADSAAGRAPPLSFINPG
jgi:hypothetical protein